MTAIARKTRMSWDLVEDFYDKHADDEGLRRVASAGVFYAWWRGELDEVDTPDEMCFLSVLREENEDLDKDLHYWAEKNEEDVKARWAKKDEEKRAAASSDGGFGDSGFGGADNNGGFGGGGFEGAGFGGGVQGDWDKGGADAGGGGNEWDAAPAASGGNDWEKENVAPSAGGSSGWDTPALTRSGTTLDDVESGESQSDNWADEVNDAQKPAPAW